MAETSNKPSAEAVERARGALCSNEGRCRDGNHDVYCDATTLADPVAAAIEAAVRAEAEWIASTVEKCGARYRELGLNEAASAAEEIAANVRDFRIRARDQEGQT